MYSYGYMSWVKFQHKLIGSEHGIFRGLWSNTYFLHEYLLRYEYVLCLIYKPKSIKNTVTKPDLLLRM